MSIWEASLTDFSGHVPGQKVGRGWAKMATDENYF